MECCPKGNELLGMEFLATFWFPAYLALSLKSRFKVFIVCLRGHTSISIEVRVWNCDLDRLCTWEAADDAWVCWCCGFLRAVGFAIWAGVAVVGKP
jgi:hypothetical protein